MRGPSTKLRRLLMSLIATSMEVSTEYNRRQNALPLMNLLDLERIMDPEGVEASLAVLDELAALTDVHKKVFETFCKQAQLQIIAALADFHGSEAMTESKEIRLAFEKGMARQKLFYQRREAWIDANRRVCMIFRDHRAGIEYRDGRLLFENPFLDQELDPLLDEIEAIHLEEVAHLDRFEAKLDKNLPAVYSALLNLKP